MSAAPAVWFPTVRTGTGTDVFTERLAAGLERRGIRVGIHWLPLRAEYAPWTVPMPKPPAWANLAHVNTWLRTRFLPHQMPIVATIHHCVHVLDGHNGPLRAAYHRQWIAPNERRVLRGANRVVVVSRYVADATRRTLCDVPMTVISNGIDTGRFHPVGGRSRQLGDQFRLLYVGSWKRLKGVDLLAPILRELGPDFVLHYTGIGIGTRERKAMPSNMHDLGRLDGNGVAAAMQQADALLFPSRSEGFGMVAAEALASGLPVIATRGSSLPEVIDDGVTGLLCARNDVSAFVRAIRRLASDVTLATGMAAAARETSLRRFGIETMVEGYLDVYRDLVANEVTK